MKNTAAKFVSAIFAICRCKQQPPRAPEAEETNGRSRRYCLLGPSASVPPGGHWYYRVDRANKRNCWYLGDAKDKAARKPVADEDVSRRGNASVASAKKTATQRSISECARRIAARRKRPPSRNQGLRRTGRAPTSRAGAISPENDPRARRKRRRRPTDRWSPPLARTDEPARRRQPQTPAQTHAGSQPQAARSPRRRAAVAGSPPADASSADSRRSIPMLLIVMVGGLSVIGVMGSAMFARGTWRRDSRDNRGRGAASRNAARCRRPTPTDASRDAASLRKIRARRTIRAFAASRAGGRSERADRQS